MEEKKEETGLRKKSFWRERAVLSYVLVKRLLCQKGFWVCLCLIPLFSTLAAGLEKGTHKAVYCALYAETPQIWREVFDAGDGLFRFYFCSTLEELKRDVVTGKAECGYVLTEDLQNKFDGDDWRWAVDVYESADTMLAEVINETVFEKVFAVISGEWYEGFIANHEAFAGTSPETLEIRAREALEKQLGSGVTFDVRTEILPSRRDLSDGPEKGGGDVTAGNPAAGPEATPVFPARGVAATGVFLCGLTGALQLSGDRKKGYFIRSPRIFTAVLTVALPVLLGASAGYAALAAAGVLGNPGREAVSLFLYGLLVTGYGLALAAAGKGRAFAGLLPFLVLGSLVCAPVFVDLSSVSPAFGFAGRLFPATYYLKGFG